MAVDHPAYREEAQHLLETQEIAKQEYAETVAMIPNLQDQFDWAMRNDIEEALALEYRLRLMQSKEAALRRTDGKPYFTRIDFTDKQGKQNVFYIGKAGIVRGENNETVVVDWRAPVANLYYSGQVGPMSYTAPDGTVEGELTLKRQFLIEDRKLVSIFDTGVVAQDAYLQDVLGTMSGDGLREIVTTIQAEQNYVIRYPLDKNLIVQGVAGSGKTTIALHRIAYLLYAFQDTVSAKQMLILAPSPLFLHYISGVLPDLGVEQVRQTTYKEYMLGLLGKWAPKRISTEREELRVNARVAAVKGGLAMEKRIADWIAELEKTIAPADGIRFGPVCVFTKEKMDEILLEEEKPFPLARRVKEFEKRLKYETKAAAGVINKWLKEECARREERIIKETADQTERGKRLVRLHDTRDAQIAKTQEQVKPFVQETMKRFPKFEPLDLYRRFWEDMRSDPDAEVRYTAEYTCKRMENGLPLEPEDIAPLVLLTTHLQELERQDIRHVIIDEAQDTSALEVRVLRILIPQAAMTIVGDMMQGVHAWRGLPDWEILRRDVFEEKCVMHHLLTSYRSTIEIMELAARVAAKKPIPGQLPAKPVLRHGEVPKLQGCASDTERLAALRDVLARWQMDKLTTIAILARSHALLKTLSRELGIKPLDPEKQEYSGGIVLADASTVKGLEFDGVILADASEDEYPLTDGDMRVLYVCLTRAIHRLQVFWVGKCSPLLAE